MSHATEEFRYLTTDEFNGLTQSEKVDYLARAVLATLNERAHEPLEILIDRGPEAPDRSHRPSASP